MEPRLSLTQRLKVLFIGAAHSPHDRAIFHKLSLIAFFAWVGLGADGLSSSCYGPQEAFLALGGRSLLAIFVALASAVTVFIISASYSQIIELFPTGGGGYFVASKLLSPAAGMVSGCALLVDYALTITLSIASGADAIFSFLPASWYPLRLIFATAGVVFLTVLNLRGVKEAVLPLVPIFLVFVVTHAFAVLWSLAANCAAIPALAHRTGAEVGGAMSELGLAGMLLLMLRAYSMGAGTYTGIEAVSNGLPILREPKVQTGKRTMRYMAVSLAFMVFGLMAAYILYAVRYEPGKTLNAVLFDRITAGWGTTGYVFVLVTLVSEAAILFVAAQTGFLDGPRVLANMALDRWVPTRFAMLSDRFVSQNGILLMGGAGLVLMLLTRGSVQFLVVLYSINVFITFVLSQLGMVRHWWGARGKEKGWKGKLLLNGTGLVLCVSILVSVTVVKFDQGGWITLLVTGTLVTAVALIKRHYLNTAKLLRSLDSLVVAAGCESFDIIPKKHPLSPPEMDRQARTAVLLVNGFNGMGLHTLYSVFRMFGDAFRNFVFVQVGMVDAGIFKGPADIEKLEAKVKEDLARYVTYVKAHGYWAEGIPCLGTDVVDEVAQLGPRLQERFPQSVFFGGRLVFPQDSLVSRWLHNSVIFSMQKTFYYQGIPFFVVPIKM
ncbi:MAG: APC family permease [Chlamydiota bacterium]